MSSLLPPEVLSVFQHAHGKLSAVLHELPASGDVGMPLLNAFAHRMLLYSGMASVVRVLVQIQPLKDVLDCRLLRKSNNGVIALQCLDIKIGHILNNVWRRRHDGIVEVAVVGAVMHVAPIVDVMHAPIVDVMHALIVAEHHLFLLHVSFILLV